MTSYEKLERLRVLTGVSADEDVLLSALLDEAGSAIILRAYPFRTDVTEVPPIYDVLHISIAQYLYNKLGAEGQTAHSENGITRQYGSADIPEEMLSRVIPYAEVIPIAVPATE